MENNADSDQMASDIITSRSGSTLFSKEDISEFSMTRANLNILTLK